MELWVVVLVWKEPTYGMVGEPPRLMTLPVPFSSAARLTQPHSQPLFLLTGSRAMA